MQRLSKLHKNLVKYSVAAIIIAIPLYPKFPFISIPGTFVSIRLEDLLILFASLLVLMHFVSNVYSYLEDKFTKSIILYLSVGLLSLLSAIFVTMTVDPLLGMLHLLRRVEYFVPFFLGLLAIKINRNDLHFYLKTLFITLTFVFLYGVGQRYFSFPIIITQNEEYSKGVALRWIEGSHINSTFAGHYDLATFLVMILPIIISLYFFVKNRKERFLMVIYFLFGLWLMVVSASRISFISYLLSASIVLVLLKKVKYIPVILLVSLLFTLFSSNLIMRYTRIFDVSIEKVQQFNLLNMNNPSTVYASEDVEGVFDRSISTPTPTPVPVFEDRSTNIRLNVEWPRAIRALLKNPLLGTGYSSITLATDNDFLRALGEVGILGFLTFTLVLLRVLLKIFKMYPFSAHFKGIELAYIVGLAGALPGILLNASFIDVFEASKFATLFWLFIGFAFGLIAVKE
jgi:hypothetical protein